MSASSTAPRLVLYNPRAARPGHHRLPLSLLWLGALLEDRVSYQIVDGNLLSGDADLQAILHAVRQPVVRYLGITIMPGPQLQRVVPQLAQIRAAAPELTLIAGGYFPSLYPEPCVGPGGVDYVVPGSGEQTLPELLQTLDSGGDVTRVPGLVFSREGQLVRTPHRDPLHPGQLPPLPYQRLEVEAYVARTHLGQRTLSHCSSVGCPFSCNFCGVAALSRGCWAAQSAEHLADLSERLVRRFGIDALEFHDHNFFASEARVASYCELLLRRGIRIGWWGLGRLDTMLGYRRETWRLLREAGLRMVFVGAESGDDQVLAQMGKGGTQSADKILQFAHRSRRHGIAPEFSFICGNPPDPGRDIRRTIRFVRRIKRINSRAEIVLYVYDPVPQEGWMWDSARQSGFSQPRTLEQWVSPPWSDLHRRRGSASQPWLRREHVRLLRDFETVLNAYHPTATDISPGTSWRRRALRLASAWRYGLQVYRWPLELKTLQRWLTYRRPEISGF